MNSFGVKGDFVKIDGKEYYKITNCDCIEPFLFTIVSANDIWMYIASNGAITAGRKDVEGAIFPYVSEDKLYHSTDSGVKTLVRITVDGKTCLWEPFSNSYIKSYKTKRNIYKSILGNEVIFEEINIDLGVCFKYKWQTCEKYGLVKTAYLENLNSYQIKAEIIDGFINILPYGIKPVVQANWSSLADGYKKTEIVENNSGVIYAMTSRIADTPSPEEMLKANFVWSICDFDYDIYIMETALADFASGKMKESISQYCSERGAYLMRFDALISPCKSCQWMIMADVGLDQVEIANLLSNIDSGKINSDIICKALEKSEKDLKCILAKSDAIQYTGDKMSSVHHLSNVSFNNMRGGLFLDNYEFEYSDFIDFVKVRNKDICLKHQDFFERIKEIKTVPKLKEESKKSNDKDLIRLCFEYLPVSFSRRHGDPSRPWNDFSIVLKNEDGTPVTNYQGNWRDIFQNWEAMSLSFPEYLDSIISKFLNASTADGFNPYKVSSDGIEWEMPDYDDPNATIGYWGDHQIIYLTRLIEWLKKYDTDKLRYLIENGAFTYADVPYEIVCFDKLMEDSKHTINHNMERDKAIMASVLKKGTDYKLKTQNGEIYYVSFAEKLIVPILAKMSNLVPGGGIWMNTQRPEWNDANNAIVGYGLSVVTVCHLKRHLSMCKGIFDEYAGRSFEISYDVYKWIENTSDIMKKYSSYIDEKSVNGQIRMNFLKELGTVADAYRKEIYTNSLSGKRKCSYDVIIEFIGLSLKYIDFTIESNKSESGLYHSYNYIDIKDKKVDIKHLKPMLEGQVAVLGCNSLNSSEAISLLEAMKNSGMTITRHLKDVSDENAVIEFEEYNRTCYGDTQYQGDMRGCIIKIGNDDGIRDMAYTYGGKEIIVPSVTTLGAVYPQIGTDIQIKVLSDNTEGRAADGYLFKPFITLSAKRRMRKGEELKICMKIKPVE